MEKRGIGNLLKSSYLQYLSFSEIYLYQEVLSVAMGGKLDFEKFLPQLGFGISQNQFLFQNKMDEIVKKGIYEM